MNETLNDILDQLNTLTAQVKDIIAEKEEVGFIFEDKGEDTSERVCYEEGTENCIVSAHKGYNADVDVLCKVTDTGNGYIAYFPTYSSVIQDNYICMDYAEADYLFKALTFLKSKK
jgi:hypothetical protein